MLLFQDTHLNSRHDPPSCFHRAACNLKLSKPRDAMEDCKKVLSVSPGDEYHPSSRSVADF